jgi:hypothetical protein
MNLECTVIVAEHACKLTGTTLCTQRSSNPVRRLLAEAACSSMMLIEGDMEDCFGL